MAMESKTLMLAPRNLGLDVGSILSENAMTTLGVVGVVCLYTLLLAPQVHKLNRR